MAHSAAFGNILQSANGFDAIVHKRRQNLSGAQLQRLAVVRIPARDAPILILDEATSALDNLSDRHVQNALDISNGNWTTILIAHRLSTLQECDFILVFDHGRIVEPAMTVLLWRQGLIAQLVASGEGAPQTTGGCIAILFLIDNQSTRCVLIQKLCSTRPSVDDVCPADKDCRCGGSINGSSSRRQFRLARSLLPCSSAAIKSAARFAAATWKVHHAQPF